jgi:hypothetical protein
VSYKVAQNEHTTWYIYFTESFQIISCYNLQAVWAVLKFIIYDLNFKQITEVKYSYKKIFGLH